MTDKLTISFPAPDDDAETVFTFCSAATGAVVSRFRGRRAYVAQNTPSGCIAFEGEINPADSKLDLATGRPIARDKAEIDAEEAARYRFNAIFAARATIAAIETKQLRVLRERELGLTTISEARDRMIGFEAQIAYMRQIITDNGGSP
jgi:hypothetical protein